MRLKDKIAVITGASSGVGRATALLFAREGAQVICVDIDEQKGNETMAMLGPEKRNSFFIKTDLARKEEIQRMAEKCRQSVKKIDILFNNAGASVKKKFEETTDDEWYQMLAVNLTPMFLCSKYLLPLIKAAGEGAIINHASVDAFLGNPHVAAYSAAKGGIIPLTHVMAYDLAKYNIRVNSLCTAGIKTGISSPGHEGRIAVTPLGRGGTPEEAAHATLFLALNESSYMTGASLVIDGGRTVLTHGCF